MGVGGLGVPPHPVIRLEEREEFFLFKSVLIARWGSKNIKKRAIRMTQGDKTREKPLRLYP